MFAHSTVKNDTALLDYASEEARPSEEHRLRDQVKKLFRHLDSAEQEFQEKEDTLKQALGLLMALARSTVKPETQALLDRLGREIKKGAHPDLVKTFVEEIKEQLTYELQPASLAALREQGATLEPKEPSVAQRRTLAVLKPAQPRLHEGEVEGKIRTMLNALLEQVHIRDQWGLQERVNDVKETLAEGGLFQRLPQVQRQLSNVFVYYRNLNDAERTRLEDVLKELIAKLAEVEKSVLNDLLENHQETISDNAKFTERLEGQVASMEEVTQLKDLSAVRAAVASRAERMRAAIQAKRAADAALSAAFTDKVQTLERRLRDATHQLSSMTDRASHDVLLADVYNRFAFNEKLTQELVRFERYQHPVSLLLFDMDRFKQINDVYGHQAGDWMLQTLAARVKPALRATDFLARFGGDEFAIVLPNTLLAGAVVVAERLRSLIEGASFSYETHKLQVSLSVRVAGVRMGDTVATVLERADQALYLAKEQGRNRVCSEEQIPPPPPSTLDKMVEFFSRKLPFRK